MQGSRYTCTSSGRGFVETLPASDPRAVLPLVSSTTILVSRPTVPFSGTSKNCIQLGGSIKSRAALKATTFIVPLYSGFLQRSDLRKTFPFTQLTRQNREKGISRPNGFCFLKRVSPEGGWSQSELLRAPALRGVHTMPRMGWGHLHSVSPGIERMLSSRQP